MRIGLYPGTFDPVTTGHTDIIKRALKLVDRLVIGVARNDEKGPLFTTDERVQMLQAEVAGLSPATTRATATAPAVWPDGKDVSYPSRASPGSNW